MKKLSLLLFAGALIFAVSSCTDTGGDEPDGKTTTAPTTYTMKAFLEYFSGAWCGYCPDGRLYEENIRNSVNENQFMSAVYHYSDNMDIPADDAINNTFNKGGYPTGMISRINGTSESRSGWMSKVNSVLNETAKCGLAISSTRSGDNITVTVKLGIGPTAMPSGNYFLTVLLTEKEMTGTGTGWDQRNYYSQNGAAAGGPTHPYYSKPDPVTGYVHKNVVRAVLSNAALGDKIDAAALEAGALTEFSFTYDASGLDSDLMILAFISEFTDNISTSGIESSFVYNCQLADVGVNKDFD